VLYGITGKIGSGKSGLLGAITGEMPNYSGMFQSSGTVAFVEQEPVIFSETIKDNIIFGKEFNATLYQRVIEQSCLISDF
jgi:ABC-type transport system involved in cytochrome bd biosynthesis fused ATPase/permease subunit